jgi:hypothetical protein
MTVIVLDRLEFFDKTFGTVSRSGFVTNIAALAPSSILPAIHPAFHVAIVEKIEYGASLRTFVYAESSMDRF